MMMIEYTSAPMKAGQNPVMSNTLTMVLASQNIRALITRVKSPRVSKFTGKVSKMIRGRTSALSRPRTKAVISAAQKPENFTPGTR